MYSKSLTHSEQKAIVCNYPEGAIFNETVNSLLFSKMTKMNYCRCPYTRGRNIEITEAIKSLQSNKAPSEDSFPRRVL